MRKMRAYAKINLALDIAGRREDGYHAMRMVMQDISLSDTVTLLDSREFGVVCSTEQVPCGPENTVRKAAAAFFSSCGICEPRVSFCIRKNIPQQAGLGGGSADAAAALVLLDRHFGTDLSRGELCRLGLSAGADVPFCLLGGTALVEGIGEELSPLPPLPPCRILICKPSAGVSTKEAFAALDRSGGGAAAYTDAVLDALKVGNLPKIAANLGNAFERLCGLPQEVEEIEAAMLTGGALGAAMTGSGSAVFGLFGENDEAAVRCRDGLLEKYAETFLCRPVGSDCHGMAG